MTRAIFTNTGSWGSGWTGSLVEYSTGDLGRQTQMTFEGFARVDDFESSGVDPVTGVPLLSYWRGIPGDDNFPVGWSGPYVLQITVDRMGDFRIMVNRTETNLTTGGGYITEGVGFHWMATVDFGAAANQEVKLYVNGASVAWFIAMSPPPGYNYLDPYTNIDAFDDYEQNVPPGYALTYFFGGISAFGVIKPASFDYCRIWNGVVATAGQAAEYGGAYRVDDGTLGTPDHLWDFDGNAEDTGSAALTLISTHEVTFDSEILHPYPPAVIGIFPRSAAVDLPVDIVAHGEPLFSSIELSLKGQTLPSGWTSGTGGSGRVTPKFTSLLLETRGSAVDSSASVTSSATYESFDARLYGELYFYDATVEVTSLVFEYEVTGGDKLGVRLSRDLARFGSSAVVEGYAELGGIETVLGSTVAVSSGAVGTRSIVPRIVRWGAYGFLFFGDAYLGSTRLFSSDEAGSLSVTLSQAASGLPASCKLSKLTTDSNVIIGNYLTSDTSALSSDRLVGKTPTGFLSDIGVKDIIIFGPWGYISIEDGFEFLRPESLLIGRGGLASVNYFTS